ncbi:Zn-dependent hydrolase [Anaerospora hongkongensis]|uniref:Zn-dependent hydrolase n=1 Tax=Anaerospora hongkongensis TaxID=244830 RepID=UPI002897F2A1|nr:Zn-dependent hydrolase [Anaerospora hongkongensis]
MDKEWIAATIKKISTWGKGTRGTSRLAFTAEDRQAKEYFISLMKEAGLAVRFDAFGNIIGRLEGRNPHAPAVVTGSHLDTVPEGGDYDGIVGVVGGLAAIKQLKEKGELTHPLELIIFAAEESSRFGFATMGSKVMAGTTNLSAWSKAKDQSGITLAEALEAQGFDLQGISNAIRQKQELKAFVELHIEQGPVLEADKTTIGIVSAIAAPTRLKITVEGMAAHSGTTPMDQRQDALVSAAMIVLAVQEIAMEQSHLGTVGTVGAMKVHPGVMNVVPGLVEMWVDIRGINHESIIEAMQDIKDAISTIAEGQDTPVSIEVLSSDKPVFMDDHIKGIIEESSRRLGISYKRMPSGAGHDAMNMAQLTAAGMIFIPCRNGISHNPEEYTQLEDIAAGVEVLTETLYQLAK